MTSITSKPVRRSRRSISPVLGWNVIAGFGIGHC